MERDPSGGREQAAFNLDVRFITDNKGIVEATYSDENMQYLLSTEEMPGPISRYDIQVDGCGDENGSYEFRSELRFSPTNDGDDFIQRGFSNFLSRKEAHLVENYEFQTYVFATADEFVYVAFFDPDCGLGLVTCGTYDKDKEIGEQIQGRLCHHQDDEMEAVTDFLEQQEELLREIYRAHKLAVSPIRLTVAPYEGDIVQAQQPEAKVRLSDLAGVDRAKEQLEEIIMGLQYPEVLKEWGVQRPNGILLYGPPGTGKTTLAEAVANELRADLITVKSDQIYGKWMGDSERNFQNYINRALAAKRPTVLLFDEIDTIIRPNAGSAYANVAGQFKQSVGRITEQNPLVVVMATTNEPDNMDEALIRAGRFDVKVYVDKPSDEGREGIFMNMFFKYIDGAPNREVFDMLAIDTKELARLTDDMTGADITTILKKLVAGRAIAEIRTRQIPPAIGMNDIVSMIQAHRTS